MTIFGEAGRRNEGRRLKSRYHYICERMRNILKLNDSPHKLSAAFALGVFIAFSPWLGLHIVSCIVLAWLLRLNKVVVLTASFINNPWTVVPIYAFCLWLGFKITGRDAAVPDIAWADMGFSDMIRLLKPYLWPYVAGTIAVGFAAAAVSYGALYWAVVRYRREELNATSVTEKP